MTGVAVLRELMRYSEGETKRWREWLEEQGPALLEVEAGEPPLATVGALLAHIAGVDLIYANALAGADAPPPESWWPSASSLEAIWAVQEEAYRKLDAFLAVADDAALEQDHQMRLHGGRLIAPAGKMVAHMQVHRIRHLAQVATALRRGGHRTPWMHDLIAGEGFGGPAVYSKEG